MDAAPPPPPPLDVAGATTAVTVTVSVVVALAPLSSVTVKLSVNRPVALGVTVIWALFDAPLKPEMIPPLSATAQA